MENFNLGDLLNKIKYPLVSEKTTQLSKLNQYGFLVDKSLKKPQIKFLLEKIFKVKIKDIRTLNLPLKTKRVGKHRGNKSLYKKTYIQLQAGELTSTLFN